MKTIIAGSREIRDYDEVMRAIEASGFKNEITEVISGMAKGPDILGFSWARTFGIPRKAFPLEWLPDGKSGKVDRAAGIKRNIRMAEYAAPDGALIAVWDGQSPGTRHMIETARKKGLRVFVWIPEEFRLG